MRAGFYRFVASALFVGFAFAANPHAAAAADLGNFESTSADTSLINGWPAVFNGHTVGCVINNNSGNNVYWFFQVLAIQ